MAKINTYPYTPEVAGEVDWLAQTYGVRTVRLNVAFWILGRAPSESFYAKQIVDDLEVTPSTLTREFDEMSQHHFIARNHTFSSADINEGNRKYYQRTSSPLWLPYVAIRQLID